VLDVYTREQADAEVANVGQLTRNPSCDDIPLPARSHHQLRRLTYDLHQVIQERQAPADTLLVLAPP
jgi:hypothetical protein